jgi:predicted ArsR family transcriptional regulator
VKFADPARPIGGPGSAGSADLRGDPEVTESRTRDRVGRHVLDSGPVTAADLGVSLGLTPAAVRRHLDQLLADGLVAVWEAPPGGPRPRGRPARRFVLTASGHAAMSSQYDDLAAAALRYLEQVVGPDAVAGFAAHRTAELEARYRPVVDAAGADPVDRADALAGALTSDGYAASTRPLQAGDRSVGTQLCQGHCPVHQVASQFPQLCEAETQAFSRLLGVHVQRLATLAHGEHVCTTHVPGNHVPNGRAGPAREADPPIAPLPSQTGTAMSTPERTDR